MTLYYGKKASEYSLADEFADEVYKRSVKLFEELDPDIIAEIMTSQAYHSRLWTLVHKAICEEGVKGEVEREMHRIVCAVIDKEAEKQINHEWGYNK